jgi:UDP-2-acetamido-3-amino-2,3-dideoxy-glucuronate N-acetyltransferase
VEDDVFFGPSAVCTNVINPRSHVPRRDQFRTTVFRVGATVGANSTIVCGTTIGRYAFIGAGTVVTRDVPDYALVYGNPGKARGWMCQCGVKLALAVQGTGRAKCNECGLHYIQDEHGVRPAEA